MSDNQQDLYEELVSNNTKQTLLLNKKTHKILIKKQLDYYNLDVFSYLKNHSDIHIPKIEDYWVEKQKLIVLEEYIQGETLASLLEKSTLYFYMRYNYVLQIMDALQFLHSANPPIIHRDLKAENIMITTDGTVKLIDYDAAKVYRANQNRDTLLIGTQGSAAPEQYGFGSSDNRTDIYALGILLKELFPYLKEIQPIIDKATKLDPSNRYQSIEEMRKDFTTMRSPFQFIFKIPGFRSHKLANMITAIIGYFIIFILSSFLVITNHSNEPISGPLLIILRILFGLLLLSYVDLFTDWTHIYSHFPFMKSNNKLLRALGYLIVLIFNFLIYILIYIIFLKMQ